MITVYNFDLREGFGELPKQWVMGVNCLNINNKRLRQSLDLVSHSNDMNWVP
jgi:hypothetical protein